MPRAKTQTPGAYFSPERLRQYKSQPLFDDTASRRIYAHHGCINTVRFSTDGRLLLTGSDDRALGLTNTNNWNVSKIVNTRHEGNIFDAHLVGEMIYSSCAGGVVLQTDLVKATSRVIQTHDVPCHTLSPSLDGHQCLAGTATGAVWQSDPREGHSHLAFHIKDRHKLGVGLYAMQRCPQDDNLVAAVGRSPLLRLFDLRSTRSGAVATFAPEHLRECTAVDISGMDWSKSGSHILLNYMEESVYEVSVNCSRHATAKHEDRYRPMLPSAAAAARVCSSATRRKAPAKARKKNAKKQAGTGGAAAAAACSTSAAVLCPGTSHVGGSTLRRKRTLAMRDVQYAALPQRSLRSTAAARRQASRPPCFGWVRHDLSAPPQMLPAEPEDSHKCCNCGEVHDSHSKRITQVPPAGDTSYVRQYYARSNALTVKGVSYMGERDKYIVCGSDDGRIVVQDRRTGRPLNSMTACFSGPANCVAPHPSGAMLLAVGGLDSALSVFQPSTDAQLLPRGGRVERAAENASNYARRAIVYHQSGVPMQQRRGGAFASHELGPMYSSEEDELSYDEDEGYDSEVQHGVFWEEDEDEDDFHPMMPMHMLMGMYFDQDSDGWEGGGWEGDSDGLEEDEEDEEYV